MHTTPDQALWLLIAAFPISIWVAWSDMKFMRIPNVAVVSLAVGFLILGLIAMPFESYLWRLSHLAIVLAIGFVLSTIRLIGAGDAKFAAAMAPFIARPDIMPFLFIFAAVLLGAFVMHRTSRNIPAVRRLTPDWESWTRKKEFPMGLALGGALIAYLLVSALPLLQA